MFDIPTQTTRWKIALLNRIRLAPALATAVPTPPATAALILRPPKLAWAFSRNLVFKRRGDVTGHMLVMWQVTWRGLVCIYKFCFFVRFSLLMWRVICWLRDRSRDLACIYKPCFFVWIFLLFFFSSFPFLICSSYGVPAIAFSHLMCGFLNRAVPLHTVTAGVKEQVHYNHVRVMNYST